MSNSRFTTASPAAVATIPACHEPDVSFVIVAYGTGPILIDTVKSLADSLGHVDAEVIVVDNPHARHPDRSSTELQLFTAGVHVIRPDRNLGFGGGCELGALHARGTMLAFVNPDITFSSDWLTPLLATLDADRSVSIVAPILLNPDGTVQEAGQWLYSNGQTAPRTNPIDRHDPVVIDYSSAACWIMRRDEHERIGGFDPAFHPAYFEDVDLALRARSLGGSCVVHGGASLIHHQGSGTPDVAEPATAQRDILLATWPSIRWQQPADPSR